MRVALLAGVFLAGWLTGWREGARQARTLDDLAREHVTTYLETDSVAVMIDSRGAILVRGVMPEAMVFHPHEPPPDISKRCRASAATAAEEHAAFVVCMESPELADALGVWQLE